MKKKKKIEEQLILNYYAMLLCIIKRMHPDEAMVKMGIKFKRKDAK